MPPTIPLTMPSRAMLLSLLKWDLKKTSHGTTRNLLRTPPSHPQLPIIHYNTHHGPHLYIHTVPHQDHIHSNYLDNQLPDPNYGRRTDGWKQTHDRGTQLPMPLGLP